MNPTTQTVQQWVEHYTPPTPWGHAAFALMSLVLAMAIGIWISWPRKPGRWDPKDPILAVALWFERRYKRKEGPSEGLAPPKEPDGD